MPKNRFVQPEVVRLELSDGDWVEVKERLTYGEEQFLAGGALTEVSGMFDAADDIGIQLDLRKYTLRRMATWILDWSFCDVEDRRVAVSLDSIAMLDPDTAEEIDAAITAHIEALEAAKNAQAPG